MIIFLKNVLRRREGTQKFFAPPTPGQLQGGAEILEGGATWYSGGGVAPPPLSTPGLDTALFRIITVISYRKIKDFSFGLY